MNATELIQTYGYGAVVVGTFFEGETIMLAAGVAAAAGLLNLPGVVAAGMVGIFLSDTVCFIVGRLLGERMARWFPKFYARMGGVFRLIERHDEKLIVFFQFMPGLCTVTPAAFGMTKISLTRFMAFDLVGNALWTSVFAVVGYSLGAVLEYALGDLHRWTTWLGAALAATLIGFLIWKKFGPRAARELPPAS